MSSLPFSSYEYEPFFETDAYYDSALREIENARSEILFESYIFETGNIGRTVLRALVAARKRGLEVTLSVDGVGSWNDMNEIRDTCLRNDIHLHVYHPVWLLPAEGWSSPQAWREHWSGFFRRINRRNHRKIIVIDRRIVYLGSANVSDVHSIRESGRSAWRDTSIRVAARESTVEIRELAETLIHSHRRTLMPLLPWRGPSRRTPSLFRIDNSRREKKRLLWDLLGRFRAARQRILITNAYFVPRSKLLKALASAARSGVQVELCLPMRTDVPFVRWAAYHVYRFLLRAGVRIFEYQPSIMHAKTMIIDEAVVIGSFNLNHRSALHDLECEALIIDSALRHKMLEQWQNDLARSKEVTLDTLYNLSWGHRAVSKLFFWFRYWL